MPTGPLSGWGLLHLPRGRPPLRHVRAPLGTLQLPYHEALRLPGLAPEEAADAVRAHWHLADSPVPHLVHLLEAHGVRVFALPPDCAKAGSFSRLHAKPAQNDATPLIFLRPGQSRHLDRRGAARALGRLVLDPDTPTPDWREQEHRAG